MRDSSGAEFFRGTSDLQVIPFSCTFITALRKSLYTKHLLHPDRIVNEKGGMEFVPYRGSQKASKGTQAKAGSSVAKLILETGDR